MYEELKNIIDNAYTPISNFKVAAIVETKDNKLFKGVNVEDASLRAGTCAERNALFNAITNGYQKGDFKRLYVMVKTNKISTPCFVCRQLINELLDQDNIIRCYSYTGDYQDYKVSELCPYPFDENDLK